MAKASLLRRIVNTVKRVFSGGGGGSQRRVTNNRDSRRVTSSNTSARRAYINAYKGERDDLERDSRKDAWEKTRNAFKASSSKATTDPKEELRQSARENRKKETKDWYKATNQKYNVSGAKDKAEELKRRQAVKSRAFDADTAVAEQKHAMKYHKNAESFARGAVSGATFGASDLLAKYGTKGEAKKAESVYQKNKNKTAEAAGEIAGNLAAFGLTSGASKAVVKKALPRTTAFAGEQGAKVAGKLAGTKLVRKAAEKEVANAVKKGLAKEVTEEAIERVAKQKAKETVANLAEDAAINLTTGKVDSAVRAIKDTKSLKRLDDLKDSKVRKEVEKNFLKNDVANVGIGSVATVGLPAGGKAIKRALGGVSEGAEKALKGAKVSAKDLAEKAAKRATDTDKRINIRDLARENERRFDKQVEDAVTIEDFEAFGLPRAEARLLAEDRAKRTAAKSVAPKRGIPRGNIKPLAETLRRNEFIPRSRNAEWRIPPRSAERVDTSIEGLSKQLDELKGRTGKTERETRAIETKIHDVTDRLERAKWRKEGGADMDAMQKAYRGEYAGFDMSKSTNGHQSEALEGKLKGRTATIVEMSPDEYMERAYRQIFKKPTEKGKTFADIPEHSEDIAKYAEAMRNGEKFPLPYLDYAGGGQEGRHRALAAKAAGIDRIPVVIIDDATNPKAIIDEVAEATAKAESSFPYEGTPEAETLVRNQQGAPLSVDEMAGVDEAMPSTNPRQTARNEATETLERRVEQIAEEPPKQADDGIKVNNVGEDATVGGRPSGVRQVRSAYEYNNGEPIEDGILTSWNEAWKASKEYSASHATGDRNRMSKVAVSQLNAMDSDAERELRQKLADMGELNYDAINTPELYDKIAKQMRDDADRYVKEMIDINQGGALDFRSTPEWQARVQYIMGTVDPSADAASEIAYTEAFKLAQNISSKGGQTLNLRRNFVHLTPMGKRDAILDDFVNILSKSKGFQNNHPQMRGLGKFDKRNYIRNVLMEDDAIRDGVEKLINTDNPDAVGDAFTELMYNVNKKNPKAGFDVLQELRYLNMLGNPKTHIRNIFGSGFFVPIREASNSIRSLIEQPIEKWATQYGEGKFDVGRHGNLWTRTTPEAKSAADEAFNALKNEILGSAKFETVLQGGRSKTKLGKGVDWLSDFNSTLLAKEDDAFKTRAFKNSYAKSYSRYVKDGKPITDKIKRKIEQEALRESQIATFNEYNSFANFLNNITRKASDANASTGARWGGRALNAVMPFTKVPANLMNQSLNYSPLGIARGMANIKTAAKAGDSAALNAAIDQLASGLTGSAVFGLGMLLGKTTDMFTTNTGKNDPSAKFKKDRGMQNYSITFKDPETGKGYSFTLDWLVPTSATFFSGVEMANQLKSGDFNVLDIGGDWSNVVTRLAEPVMETSMLSGLHGMLETMRSGSNSDDEKGAIGILLRETVQSYMNSLIPTVLGQAARTAYKSDMQIVGEDDWEYWRNQAKSKAGLANTNILGEPLGADTDAYGNVKGEKKNSADYAKSALKNFLSPANIQKVDFSKVDDEKLRVFEEAVKNGADPEDMAYLFPKKQYKKQFKVADEEIKMSNRDVSTYNQAKTKGGEEGMRYILENIMFNRRTTDEKGKNVPRDDAYTQEMKDALMQEYRGKSMREVEEWLYAQPEFKSASDAEKQKAINGLWTLENPYGNATANASRRVGEQAVYKAQGKDVNEYNFKNEVTEKKRDALMPAISAGLLSYEQAVDFDRNASKKSYYENESGGEAKYTYSQESIMNYLSTLDAPEETKKALYDAYYTGKQTYEQALAKQGKKGKGGRRRRGYRRRGGGGGSSTVKTSVPIKASDYKASKATYKDAAEGLKSRSSSKKKTKVKATPTVKVEPPKVKFKKYEV